MVLGLATGTTPIPLYQNLIKAYQDKLVSFKDITTFNLDEYIGLPKTHKESYLVLWEINYPWALRPLVVLIMVPD